MVISTVIEADLKEDDENFQLLTGQCGLIDLFMSCADYPVQKRKGKIVGGKKARIGEFPWQVKIVRKKSGVLICGGSLLCEKFVLTAAHCVTNHQTADPFDPRDVDLILGDHRKNITDPGEVIHEVKRWIVHPSYSPVPNFSNDIAIIELKKPAKINKFVNTACLPFSEPNDDSTVIISGWGKLKDSARTDSKVLQKAEINIISRKQCKDMYSKPSPYGVTGEINENMICAASKGKDSCQGDSGGNV